MKEISEAKIEEETRRGKNEPMAKDPKVAVSQNGETKPTRQAARKQPGTDEAKPHR